MKQFFYSNSLNYLNKNVILLRNYFYYYNNNNYRIKFCGEILPNSFKVHSNNGGKNRLSIKYRKNYKLIIEQKEALIKIMLRDGYL